MAGQFSVTVLGLPNSSCSDVKGVVSTYHSEQSVSVNVSYTQEGMESGEMSHGQTLTIKLHQRTDDDEVRYSCMLCVFTCPPVSRLDV